MPQLLSFKFKASIIFIQKKMCIKAEQGKVLWLIAIYFPSENPIFLWHV